MSLKDKILEKKSKELYNMELTNNGITLNSIAYKSGGIKDSRVFLCLVRALLLFFASFGTICGTVSAFEAPFKLSLVLIPSLIICFLIAFIYYNKVTFYVGYTLFFLFFSVGIFSLYIYVNSGFQAFINIIYEKYSDYFHLSSLRSAEELISNRTLTISIAMIFLIAFLSLLLNITISGYMSLIETFLITFPLLQLPLYINITPNIVYLIMVLGSYIAVAILGRSSHHRIPDIGKRTTDFIHTGKIKNRYHSYISDGNSMLINMFYGILLSMIILIFSSFFLYSDEEIIVTNKLKQTTDACIKAYMQNGVWGLFDRYKSSGGLNSGQLGGVSSIHPDFQTDLKVTFVPQTLDSVYLKGFVGTNYSYNSFEPAKTTYSENNTTNEKQYGITETFPYDDSYSSRMKVKNIDITDSHYYMPYYSGEIISENNAMDGNEYTICYSPYEEYRIYENSANPPSKEYEDFVHQDCLNVPYYLDETLSYIIQDAGINTDEYINASEEEKNNATLKLAKELRRYFIQNYSYTMSPGSTPPKEEFINYFLTEQKRGFCAHFAASSTMLLRYMGVPARYVEGYMFSSTEMSDATALSDDISEWVGDVQNITLQDTGLIEVDIDDSCAHAWTEIYLDGYGWIPFDFTPPSNNEEAISDFNFSSLFSGLFLSLPENVDNDSQNKNSHFSFDFGRTFGFSFIPMLIMLGVVFLLIISYYVLPIIITDISKNKAQKNGNYNTALKIYYKTLINKIIKTQKIKTQMSVKDFISFSDKLEYNETKPDKQLLSETIDKALYSQHNITQDEYNACISELKLIKNILKHNTKNNKQSKKTSITNKK